MRRLCALCFCCASSTFSVHSQNLVPNPGFEEFYSCPGSISLKPDEFRVPGWSSVSLATPDHYHSCSTGDVGVPYNWAGVSPAFDGNGYAGIYVWLNTARPEVNNYREYLQCKLLEPLRKDSTYIIEFHYKLSSYSRYSVDRIGLHLTDSALVLRNDNVIETKPVLEIVQDSALTFSTGLWETGRTQYRAQGGEQFVIIGNFSGWHETRHYKIQFRATPEPMLAEAAYYYIDDVKVIPAYLKPEEILAELLSEFDPETIQPDKTYVLKNIEFEFNSFDLKELSFPELDKVLKFALRDPRIRIQLSGHTDDIGPDDYNETLSLNRAKSVARYLEQNGISKTRIQVFGFGEKNPIIQSNSDASRKLNRRVEIRFIN